MFFFSFNLCVRLVFKNNTYVSEYGTLLTISFSDDESLMDVSIGNNLAATYFVGDQRVQHRHYYRIHNGVVKPTRADPNTLQLVLTTASQLTHFIPLGSFFIGFGMQFFN